MSTQAASSISTPPSLTRPATARAIAREMLVSSGYVVETARDGAEAVALYRAARESGKPFDAAILDLTVPGRMGGKETIRELLAIDPDVRAIVFSGYSNDPVMADCRKYGFRGVLPKPFTMNELRNALRQVIAEPRLPTIPSR